jgi:putative transposase
MSSPDLIGRDFDPVSSAPGERLVGDITYLKTGEGWLHRIATAIDIATRMVVGRQVADHMRTSLVVDALAMWTLTRSSTATEVPGQYTSAEFHRFCKENLIQTRVGRTGCAGTTPPPKASSPR